MSTPSRSKMRQPTPSSSNTTLFTESDEVRLLKTLEKLTQSTQLSPQLTVDSENFNRINSVLNSKFTRSQVNSKLRRLRTKYHKQARSKSLIKTPHDQKLFNIARKLWGKQTKRKFERIEDRQSSDKEDQEEEANEAVVGVEAVRNGEQEEECEEVVNLEVFPALVGELSKYFPLNLVWRNALRSLGSGKLREMDEKWKSIGIEEAKIVIKKAELVKQQTLLIKEVLGDPANGN
ncbi:GLABROUS1 enhancer-binding protein-like [Mangifera indica]|uniref:GLABROUS1 enhancer-binding protein-like n=1 Tax=Mangifera indica TaxID=29780 RepID=UPI001CFA4E86|nr:GLABROUS1 enhancer-binding protein-like [Mangifera indica]